MKLYNVKSTCVVLALLAISMVSCNETPKTNTAKKPVKKTETKAVETKKEKEVEKEVVEEEVPKEDTIKITLNSNDNMQFDKRELTVYEGQTVVLTLHHTGTMPAVQMGHNFVLLSNDVTIAEFAKNAAGEKENDFIPKDGKNIIAHTDLIGGGESTSITFNAPAKGSYNYICSFPGHYGMMKGKFRVK